VRSALLTPSPIPDAAPDAKTIPVVTCPPFNSVNLRLENSVKKAVFFLVEKKQGEGQKKTVCVQAEIFVCGELRRTCLTNRTWTTWQWIEGLVPQSQATHHGTIAESHLL
jgi:hypothetical protein